MNRREFILNTMLLTLSSNSFSNIIRAKNTESNKGLSHMELLILYPQLEWEPG